MTSHQRALEDLDVPVMLIGRDMRVSFANRVVHRLLGYPPGDLRGLPMQSLLGPHRQGELRNFEQVLQGGGARRLRSVLRRHDGRTAQVSLMMSACADEDGQIIGVQVRVDAPAAASAAASAAAQSRGAAESGVLRSSRPPAGALRDTLPEAPAHQVDASWTGHAMHSPTLPPPAPSTQRWSEHRLSQPNNAPQEALLSELGDKLGSLSQHLDWLQRHLKLGPEDERASRAELSRSADEMRALLDRARELEHALAGRRPTRAHK